MLIREVDLCTKSNIPKKSLGNIVSVSPHTVYLALTSAVKVGITSSGNENTRWIDQGAWKTIKLADVPDRYTSGLIEVALKEYISDKTKDTR